MAALKYHRVKSKKVLAKEELNKTFPGENNAALLLLF